MEAVALTPIPDPAREIPRGGSRSLSPPRKSPSTAFATWEAVRAPAATSSAVRTPAATSPRTFHQARPQTSTALSLVARTLSVALRSLAAWRAPARLQSPQGLPLPLLLRIKRKHYTQKCKT